MIYLIILNNKNKKITLKHIDIIREHMGILEKEMK